MRLVPERRVFHTRTGLALVAVARRATYPQALMKPYRKGER